MLCGEAIPPHIAPPPAPHPEAQPQGGGGAWHRLTVARAQVPFAVPRPHQAPALTQPWRSAAWAPVPTPQHAAQHGAASSTAQRSSTSSAPVPPRVCCLRPPPLTVCPSEVELAVPRPHDAPRAIKLCAGAVAAQARRDDGSALEGRQREHANSAGRARAGQAEQSCGDHHHHCANCRLGAPKGAPDTSPHS